MTGIGEDDPDIILEFVHISLQKLDLGVQCLILVLSYHPSIIYNIYLLFEIQQHGFQYSHNEMALVTGISFYLKVFLNDLCLLHLPHLVLQADVLDA